MNETLEELLMQINALRDNHRDWSDDERDACAAGLQIIGAKLARQVRTLSSAFDEHGRDCLAAARIYRELREETSDVDTPTTFAESARFRGRKVK